MRFGGDDVRQRALREIAHAVTGGDLVAEFEAGIRHRQVDGARPGLHTQRAQRQRSGFAHAQQLHQVQRGPSAHHHAFDQQYVAVLQRLSDVERDADFAAFRRARIRGETELMQSRRHLERAHQVRAENTGPVEQAHDVELPARIVARYAARQLRDALADDGSGMQYVGHGTDYSFSTTAYWPMSETRRATSASRMRTFVGRLTTRSATLTARGKRARS